MEKLYESEFKVTLYEPENSLIINNWKDEKEMTDEDFKEEIISWVELVEKYNPENLIADTRKFNYTVSVELQEWNEKKVFPRLANAGVKKFAVIESEELVAQLSLEQTMDVAGDVMQHQFFTSQDEARAWML
jgi:hypothetical protein